MIDTDRFLHSIIDRLGDRYDIDFEEDRVIPTRYEALGPNDTSIVISVLRAVNHYEVSVSTFTSKKPNSTVIFRYRSFAYIVDPRDESYLDRAANDVEQEAERLIRDCSDLG